MDLDRARILIGEIEERKAELSRIFAGGEPLANRKPQRCSKCGEEGHSARTCMKQADLHVVS